MMSNTTMRCGFSVLIFGLLGAAAPTADAAEAKAPAPPPALERIAYGDPGLTVDLGVGLWAWPVPMDFDGDGDLDLVVACPDVPYNGTYFFENPDGNVKFPVFKAGVRISQGASNITPSYVDGGVRVMAPGAEYPGFRPNGLANPVKLPLPANIHPQRVRANQWRYTDYDGDGNMDLVVGVGDWTEYGWDNAFDAEGRWTRGPLHGFVYLLRNGGTNDAPEYEQPVKIEAGGTPVDVYGMPSPNFGDFDGDGDLDLICGEFVDTFTYFENVGTRTRPEYAAGRPLALGDRPLTMDLCMIVPVALDWDGDGDLDLVVGQEDGRVALVEHTGKVVGGLPLFAAPRFFQQQADDLKFGALVTPVAFDWDADGDLDLVCGNTAGYIGWIENLDGACPAKWAAPKLVEADGRPIRILAGPNGSIQGPCEAKWGYTTQTVCDWDGDGRLDIVANSILGKVHWYRNIGTRRAPALAAAQPVEVEWAGDQPALAWGWMRPEGKALLTQWRTTPVTVDWNRDRLVDLVMLDQEGFLAFFERALRDGRRVLLHPQRVFCNEKGEPLQFNSGRAGRSGRRKLCVTDWDGDGRLDILINSKNAEWWRQTAAKDGRFFFENMGNLHIKNIEGHDVSPTVVDFDDNGMPDFIGGAEDGFLYYLPNPRAAGQAR